MCGVDEANIIRMTLKVHVGSVWLALDDDYLSTESVRFGMFYTLPE